MRSILEKAFLALLNEESDKAEELFHKFIVERARQIHESNRAGEDYVLGENWQDEIKTESYFTEEDLSDLDDEDQEEGHEGDDEDDMDMDMDGEVEDMDDGEEAGEDDMADLDHEEEDEDSRIDHLEDQIEKLTAEFEAMMDAIGEEGDVADHEEDEMHDDDMDMHDEDDMDDEDMADGVEDDMADTGDHAMEDEEMDECDYDDITESIVAELEKVSVSLEDGKEIGAGKTIVQNRGAALPQKSEKARMGGAPIKMKDTPHKGFDRETPPATKDMKARRNNVKTTSAAEIKVSKEGDKSAALNKPMAGSEAKGVSPIDGK